MVREGRVFINPAGRPAYGGNYRVKACAVGAQVRSASSGTTINVHAGHGFSVGNKFIVGTDIERYREVTAVSSQQLEVDASVSVANNELLINIGSDTGSTGGPNFDGTAVQIYTDMAYQDAPADATVTADSVGRYRYWHKGVPRWELVLALGTPVAVYMDTGNPDDEDQVSYQVRYAHLFATGGTGTEADPWVTAGSNPVQAAIDDLPVSGDKGGGVVRLIPGVYSIDGGPNGNGVEITHASQVFGNITIEGTSAGGRRQESSSLAYYDAVVLKYSGTKAAIKVGHWATNRDFWCENVTLRGFKLLQTGASGTGIGILTRLFRFGTIEDLKVNNFSTCIAMSGVSDFNKIVNVSVRQMGQYGIDVGRGEDENGSAFGALAGECNGNRFFDCDFLSGGRGNGVPCWGLYIHAASVNNTVAGCEFHDFNTSGFGGMFISPGSYDSVMTVVRDSYFEGNWVAIKHSTNAGVAPPSLTPPATGLLIEGNYINQCEFYGVWVNNGSDGRTDGFAIIGNTFLLPNSSAPYATTIAIQLGTYTKNFTVLANSFIVQAPTPSGTFPGGNLNIGAMGDIPNQQHVFSGPTRFINTPATETPSPVTMDGTLTVGGNLTLTAGTVTGDITTTGNITSGGHLQGLMASFNLSSNDVIPHGGRFMVNITNVSGTNTFTVAAPSGTDGKLLILKCEALTSGTMSLADSGNVDLSAAWTPNAGDTLTLVAEGVVWYELCRSAN